MITFKNVSKSFKEDFWSTKFNALNDINFTIKEGKLTGFLGANGAGKTTSIKLMLDLIRPSEGEVLYHPSLGSSKNEIFKNIGFFPERPYFYPHLSAEDFIYYCGKLNDASSFDINQRLNYWAEILNIKFAIKRKIRTFSKGMLQKLGLIACVIHDPKLIILDEPMAGLDPVGRVDFKDAFKKLFDEGKTIFFSSHIVSDIEEVCSDVLVLEKGNLLFDCELKDLLKNTDLDCEISYIDNDQKVVETVKPQEKSKKLEDLFLQKKEIISVLNVTMRLEDVIYKEKQS